MSNTSTPEPTAADAADLRAAIGRCISEMDQPLRWMRRDQAEIEESEARTRGILAEVEAELEVAKAPPVAATIDGWLGKLLAELRHGFEHLYGDRLRGIYLFGSWARGKAGAESDVDVLIVLDEVSHYFEETERTSELISSLSLTYEVSISCVFMPVAEWNRGEGPFLLTVRDDAIAA